MAFDDYLMGLLVEKSQADLDLEASDGAFAGFLFHFLLL